MNEFSKEVAARIAANGNDQGIIDAGLEFLRVSTVPKYSYNFSFLGRPIIQYPQDMVAMQELIWEVKPDLIIETGIAHGGSLIMSASMLALLDYCYAKERGQVLDPSRPHCKRKQSKRRCRNGSISSLRRLASGRSRGLSLPRSLA